MKKYITEKIKHARNPYSGPIAFSAPHCPQTLSMQVGGVAAPPKNTPALGFSSLEFLPFPPFGPRSLCISWIRHWLYTLYITHSNCPVLLLKPRSHRPRRRASITNLHTSNDRAMSV